MNFSLAEVKHYKTAVTGSICASIFENAALLGLSGANLELILIMIDCCSND